MYCRTASTPRRIRICSLHVALDVICKHLIRYTQVVEAAEFMDSSTWKAVPASATDTETHSVQEVIASDILTDCMRTVSEKKKNQTLGSACADLSALIPRITAYEVGPSLSMWCGHLLSYCHMRELEVNVLRDTWRDIAACDKDFLPFKSLQNLARFESLWKEGFQKVKDSERSVERSEKLKKKRRSIDDEIIKCMNDTTIQEGCFRESLDYATGCLELVSEVGADTPDGKEFLKHLSGT